MYFPKLKDIRNDKDLSQTDIAKVLKISQTVYSRYERGIQNLPLQHLITLADFYHTSTDLSLIHISLPISTRIPTFPLWAAIF